MLETLTEIWTHDLASKHGSGEDMKPLAISIRVSQNRHICKHSNGIKKGIRRIWVASNTPKTNLAPTRHGAACSPRCPCVRLGWARCWGAPASTAMVGLAAWPRLVCSPRMKASWPEVWAVFLLFWFVFGGDVAETAFKKWRQLRKGERLAVLWRKNFSLFWRARFLEQVFPLLQELKSFLINTERIK